MFSAHPTQFGFCTISGFHTSCDGSRHRPMSGRPFVHQKPPAHLSARLQSGHPRMMVRTSTIMLLVEVKRV